MATYTATAVSEGDHWVIDVPGIRTTEATSVGELREMPLDLVIAMTHADPENVHLDLRIV